VKKVKGISSKNVLLKGSRKALLVLVLAVIVTVAAMSVSSLLAERKLNKQAQAAVESHALTMKRVTSIFLMSFEWVNNSFISNIADVQIDSMSGADEFNYSHVVNRELMENYSLEDIQMQLHNYIHYNYEFHSVVLILEPDKYANIPGRGVALAVFSGNDTVLDLLDSYDVFKSDFYAKGAVSKCMEFGHNTQMIDATPLITMAIPLNNEHGDLVGEFWVNVSPDYYSSLLQYFQLDKKEKVLLINKDGYVVASTVPSDNFKSLWDNQVEIGSGCVSDKLAGEICKHVTSRVTSKFSIAINGETYWAFTAPLNRTSYSILVVEPESEIYDTVSVVSGWIFCISVCGLVILAACLFYVFLLYKKKSDQKQKIENDLAIASTIQQEILPPNPTDEERLLNPGFDVLGFQRTARSVGGDLYDYVVKDGKLHFCIGDVSGKGVPAALKMTELCSLYRYVVRTETDAANIMSSINNAVMERSDDSVFCTLFVGVLDLQSGHLEFCNAGHNPPVVIRQGGKDVQLLTVTPNMPVYAFENYPYQKESMDLQAGDRLFCYTDGVTEARNANDFFFGTKATLAVLKDNVSLSSERLVKEIMARIERFTNSTEQNDDITMLFVEYKGKANGSLKPEGHLHYEKVGNCVVDIVNDTLNACGLSDDLRLRLALEEPIQNIADYAYPEDGPLDVVVTRNGDHTFLVTLIDVGQPFNPLLTKAPDLSIPIDKREEGGLGIHFTRQIMEEVSYEYKNQHNFLHLKYKKK